MESPAVASIVVLVRDLIFSTKISSTAAALGVTVKIVRDPSKLSEHCGRRLIVDLNLDGAIEASKQWILSNSHDVIGFVAHADAETIGRARAANIARIVPRSQFVQMLSDLLR